MVRTRNQSRHEKQKKTHLENSTMDSKAKSFDIWDIPCLDSSKSLRSTIIKTYSKKRPRRVTSTSRPHFLEPDFPDFSSKTDNCQGTKTANYPSGSNIDNIDQETLTGKRKREETPNSSKQPSRQCLSMIARGSCQTKRNKTIMSVHSMTGCTMMNTFGNDDIHMNESMSLCSVFDGTEGKNLCSVKTHNSTVMADCENIGGISEYIPGNISIIKGDGDQKTIASLYNEKTPAVKQSSQTSISAKKVKFMVSRTGQTSKTYQNDKPRARRSILKPNISPHSLCPSKETTKETKTIDVESDTEKLLEFEPLALECSEDIENYRDITPECSEDIESYRNITPETTNSPKSLTGNRKEKRRLSYLPCANDPVCILLDFAEMHKEKKMKVLFGKNWHSLSVEESNGFPADILLSKC